MATIPFNATAANAELILEYCEDGLDLTPEATAKAAAVALRKLTKDSGLAQSILTQVCNDADDPSINMRPN